MNNFKDWGVRIRRDNSKNYYSVWNNLKTTRLDLGNTIPLSPERSEFYDVGITEKCNAMCPFCYVEADASKKDYNDVCDLWKRWIATFPDDCELDFKNDNVLLDILAKPGEDNSIEEIKFKIETMLSLKRYGGTYTEKPFQVAIGSVGEPTVSPDLCKFLETVYETKVVPNYTTNGIILAGDTKKSDEIMEATRNFCGGVAVSFGNKSIRPQAEKAVEKLVKSGECKVMIHELIGSNEDVDEMLEMDSRYGKDIHYHVLLPLMKHGRSETSMDTDTYKYLISKINELGMTNVAFGANFAPFMKANDIKPDVWEYPQECYSKNILLNEKVIITPSSYNLSPIYETL